MPACGVATNSSFKRRALPTLPMLCQGATTHTALVHIVNPIIRDSGRRRHRRQSASGRNHRARSMWPATPVPSHPWQLERLPRCCHDEAAPWRCLHRHRCHRLVPWSRWRVARRRGRRQACPRRNGGWDWRRRHRRHLMRRHQAPPLLQSARQRHRREGGHASSLTPALRLTWLSPPPPRHCLRP